MSNIYKLGIDIGSTTVKVAVIDETNNILYSEYRRHFANIQETLADLVGEAKDALGEITVYPVITGSGGLQLSKHLDTPFVQEVVAVSTSLRDFAPHCDVAIELGGEDAKIIYFSNGIEQRMNGVCAGGTGSFIDQMASLLQTDSSGLNEYAKNYKALYPIAARCGVFAKTDIQPLINEGATKEDLAASIFQAVVNQTISGLACGKPIRGNVAFLGGPLHFLSELKQAFIRTLKLTPSQTIAPEHSHLFAATGAAMNYDENYSMPIEEMRNKLAKGIEMDQEISRMDPLFESEADYDEFKKKHAVHTVVKKDIKTHTGNCYLGIDAGSTTTKVALVDDDGNLLYSFYDNNNGNMLGTTIRAMKEIEAALPESATIVNSCSTGYGEALVKAALRLDEGEVETVSHYYAASFFDPNVDAILDIGGQDMKFIKVKNGIIDNVMLNEACSSGCGSFIETFAKSLNYSVIDFAKEALFAKNPIDLGTRCTVFMNSNVKQAQKEGASVADISAGLAYSVIKNALFKVIKIADPAQLGKNIVVQGGTFYNDAVLRSFEKIAEHDVTRPDIAGIMGAFGAALIARERHEDCHVSHMLSFEEINEFSYTTSMTRCKGCLNNCLLTVNKFNDGRNFISGNRCEKGLGKEKKDDSIPNLYKFKNDLLFNRELLTKEQATRGTVGLPRVLNMFENYPFWATFFTKLGFSVVLSPMSSRKIYEMGIESIPSESECYPAKLAHGHIEWLIAQNVDFIFYPCIAYERTEVQDANNHYNCPIVTSYPENIKNNVEDICNDKVKFLNPFLAMTDYKVFSEALVRVFAGNNGFMITEKEILDAAKAGWDELAKCRQAVLDEGKRVLKYLDETGKQAIVLAGRPYHIDNEINHGIPELITSYGVAVLSEDSISDLAEVERPLIVLDQWMYHSRLYKAANYIKQTDNLNLIQLNSFGCGLDAVTTDCVNDILSNSGKIYTVLKIDEVNNLGAARIRVRSLLSALKVREKLKIKNEIVSAAHDRVEFTKEMRENYTVIAPQMSPIHFDLIAPALRTCGFNVEVLDNDNRQAVNAGLKYVNNDACYPSIIVVGQIMHALTSGKYDLNKTAVLITQTGGGCRASNYIGFIRRALAKAGMGHIPVISLSVQGLEKNSGFKPTLDMIYKALYAICFGDIFMRVLYRMRPYEIEPGSANALHEKWKKICIEALCKKGIMSRRKFAKLCRGIVEDFDKLPIHEDMVKPRVGVVGEILVKFLPMANNHIIDLLEREGAEGVMPDLLDFMYYSFYNNYFKVDHYGIGKKHALLSNVVIKYMNHVRKPYVKACEKSKHFDPPTDIRKVAAMASEFVSIGNQTGEGWFLTGEMLELIHSGAPNIVCSQPFACLPNHIIGKGVIKELRNKHPEANIVAVDYDPGASEVNQLNRIKLMLATARENLKK